MTEIEDLTRVHSGHVLGARVRGNVPDRAAVVDDLLTRAVNRWALQTAAHDLRIALHDSLTSYASSVDVDVCLRRGRDSVEVCIAALHAPAGPSTVVSLDEGRVEITL